MFRVISVVLAITLTTMSYTDFTPALLVLSTFAPGEVDFEGGGGPELNSTSYPS